MKLVTFAARTPSGLIVRAGVQRDDTIVDVDRALAAYDEPTIAGGREEAESDSDMLTLVRGGERAVEAARGAADRAMQSGDERSGETMITWSLADVQLLAPLPRPNSLRDYLLIKEHFEGVIAAGVMSEIPDAWYEIPGHWKGNADEIYGPDDTVPWPAFTDKLDYELEIGAVIGTAGRRISSADAGRHIVGYTLFNDWSARDIQAREMSIGNGPGICKDFGTSLGPCIATPDEFDRDHARLEARIDGDVWSSGTLGTMHFSFEEIIAWTSQEQTLRPGDVLGSGTVGKGCGVELDRWISQGSVVELEAEGIGTLRNVVGHKGQGPSRVIDLEAAR